MYSLRCSTRRHAAASFLSKMVIAIALVAFMLPTTVAAENAKILKLWRHQTAGDEVPANLAAIERFNKSQSKWHIDVELLPQGSYTSSITASALAGRLPCILDVDQPAVANFAWSRHLQPLDQYIPSSLLQTVSPGALGIYKDRIYSVGQYDAALAIFARRSVLEKLALRIPTQQSPWDLTEFDQVLTTIEASEDFRYALDLYVGEGADWWTYAFGPFLQSFGGDLIDRSNMVLAEGTLNGPNAIQWGKWFQSLFTRNLVNRRPPDDKGFVQGRVALAYSGNWLMPEFEQTFGDDLLVLPPPALAETPVIGAGSWQWAISKKCPYPEGAAELISFLLQADEIAAISKATGLIPVTEDAAALTEKYNKTGPWRAFYDFMQAYAKPRPATPAFPFISSNFHKAAKDIMDGTDVRDALDDAVDAIEINIADNKGYGFIKNPSGRRE